MDYKWCLVPQCTSTTKKTPQKIFIMLPSERKMRKTWLDMARRDSEKLSEKSRLWICEDHFNIEKDMENFMEYKLMGSVKRIRMQKGCIPTKFNFQPKDLKRPKSPRSTANERIKVTQPEEIETAKNRAIPCTSSSIMTPMETPGLPLPSSTNVPIKTQNDAASTSAIPFAEPPTNGLSVSTTASSSRSEAKSTDQTAAPKSNAQKQREYRQRLKTSRDSAKAIAARKSAAERQRKYQQRLAAHSRQTAPAELVGAPKSNAQKQREYRERLKASRDSKQVVAARKSNSERQRKYQIRKDADGKKTCDIWFTSLNNPRPTNDNTDNLENEEIKLSVKAIPVLSQLNSLDFGHESSQFIPIAPKKPNNDMANYTDFRFTHQNTMERTLNTSVGTCTTYSSTDQMQQTNMSESCEPLLGVYIKEEKLDEIIPCDLCLDVFCSMENLMRHVNDKHMKIEINEEPLEKKIKQENNVEDDIHMNDDSFRVEIKEEIIDQIKKEETEQIEEDIS